MAIEMEVMEQYLHVVLSTLRCKVVLIFKSVDKILSQSNESY